MGSKASSVGCLASLFIFVLACKPVPQAPGVPSTTRAYVNQDQLNEARLIIKSIDYLPFDYKADGCFARSSYMSMELAANRIPSSAQGVSICATENKTDSLNQTESWLTLADKVTRWKWHVAPLLVVDVTYYIVDPAMDQVNQIMERSDWMSNMTSPAPTNFKIAPASLPQLTEDHDVPCNRDDGQEHMVSNFDDQRPFDFSNVKSDCALMYYYISKIEGLSDVARASMQERLVERTIHLVETLASLGKISDSMFGPSNSEIDVNQVDTECRSYVEK